MKTTAHLAAAAALALLLTAVPATAEWKIACQNKNCQLFFEIVDAEKGVQSRVYFHDVGQADGVHVHKAKTFSRRIIGIATVPLGIFLPAGIEVKIDDEPLKAELVDCTIDQGCRAAFEADAATLDAMKAGKRLSLTVQDRHNGRAVTFAFGLAGFDKAYDEFLKKL